MPGGLGIFDTLHGFEDGDLFARHLKKAAAKFYGTASRAFLAGIGQSPAWPAACAYHRWRPV
jgi:hypothetical protein